MKCMLAVKEREVEVCDKLSCKSPKVDLTLGSLPSIQYGYELSIRPA